jgi:hypothetical protein
MICGVLCQVFHLNSQVAFDGDLVFLFGGKGIEMKKHQKQFFALAVTLVFTAMVILLTGSSEAGKTEKPDPVMDMLQDIYDVVLDTNSKVGVPAPVPQTGQTNCYDTAGIEIDCAGTGQDGEYQYGTPFPKPRFTDNKDGTVTDNMTGLMWTIDAILMASRDPGFDADDISGDGAVTWQHALDYVAKLNQEAYLGFTDWRLPNVREMLSLIDYGYRRPTLTPDHPFINVEPYPAVYWSSTSYVGSDDVFHVAISNGTVSHVGRDGSKYVWPVRGGN